MTSEVTYTGAYYSKRRWTSTTSTWNTNTGYYDDYYATSTSTSSDSYWVTITTSKEEKNIKKLLKRMADDMCKKGWINYMPYYFEPKLKPISLRGVRYDGRGWANI